MQTNGIRILDENNGVVSVKLQDILKEIRDGEFYHWSILYFYGMGHLKDGKSIPDFEKEIIQAEKGIIMQWGELNVFADTLYQVFDLLIIGCKDLKRIARYKNDKDMYEICDVVINMFDRSYWEVFSKDVNLIHRLAAKFKDIEILTDYSFLQNS